MSIILMAVLTSCGARSQSVRRNQPERTTSLHTSTSKISVPEYHVIRKGDTLWSVSRKMGVSLNTIIRSNYNLARKGRIFPGDKLAIR